MGKGQVKKGDNPLKKRKRSESSDEKTIIEQVAIRIMDNVDPSEYFICMLQYVMSQRDHVRPWGEFFRFDKFRPTMHIPRVRQRMNRNTMRFKNNYFVMGLAFTVFYIMTSPLLLLACGAVFGVASYLSTRAPDYCVVAAGQTFDRRKLLTALLLISVPLLYLAGAVGAAVWITALNMLLIGVHSGVYAAEGESRTNFDDYDN